MNEINTTVLNSYIKTLDKSLDYYYDYIYLNLYNEIKNSHFDANTPIMNRFYNEIDVEKQKNYGFYVELVKFKKIYEYINSSYQEIGKTIKFDLSEVDKTMNKFEQIKNVIKRIKMANSNIRVTNSPGVVGIINSNNNLLTSMENTLETIQKAYKNMFDKIEGIEKNIKGKIDGMDIQTIKETEIRQFIGEVR